MPTSSLLGPAFSVSVLPDSVGKPLPDVRLLYFSNIDTRSQTEINAALHSMRVTSNQIAGSLHAMVKTLLAKVNDSSTHLKFFPNEVRNSCCAVWCSAVLHRSVLCA